MPTSRSTRGKEFSFESPIPGLHIYNIELDEDLLEKLKNSSELQREDYYKNERFGKSSLSLWIEHQDPATTILADAFEEVVDSYFVYYRIGPNSREGWRFSKFEPGDFFGSHPDDSYATPRTASLTYYPNDDYEGGEIEFEHFGVKIKPKKNQLFIFPSGYSYRHFVHPITSGIRYNLVTFFSNMTYEEKQARIDLVGEHGQMVKTKYLLR